jgi:hypothetical protein
MSPGDIVHWPVDKPADHPDGRRVVVDMTDEGMAVLRQEQDVAGQDLVAVEASHLTVVGRLTDAELAAVEREIAALTPPEPQEGLA